jgi:Tfp pilus assembly protein PilX
MRNKKMIDTKGEKGIALVTTLLLTLLLSILVGAMLASSTSDVLITGNDIRTNQAFYIAEAGINRGAGWFSSKFGTSPTTGLFILPQQNASNTTGATGQLSYTSPPTQIYQKGASNTSYEQTIPTCVKVLAGINLQNVVLSGDSTNTYPASYTVNYDNPPGTPQVASYTQVVSDFTNNLFNQTEGEGRFSVKATLISIIPPSVTQPQGNATWLLESTGTITRGNNTTVATATLWAYISAIVRPINVTQTGTTTSTTINVTPGVIGRIMVSLGANQLTIDSYKSSYGQYNAALAANTYAGQQGSTNLGTRGDVRTNDEAGGYINITNGVVSGNAFATLPAPTPTDTFNPIQIDTSKVLHTISPQTNYSTAYEYYGQNPLIFPDIPDVAPPPSGSPDYTLSTNTSKTLPSGHYNNLSVSKGTLSIPPGTYGSMNLTSQGSIVLGVPKQTTVYNFQQFNAAGQGSIIFAGPVVINVESSLNVGAQGQISDTSLPASAIRWNFKGGSGQTVSVGGGGNTLGVFYSPNNDLELQGGTTFYGTIAARNINLGGNAAIHIDEDAITGVQTTQTVSTTTSVTVGYTAANYSLWRITQAIN